MIESGLLLFFIVPGLLVYCAIYGSFQGAKAIAPEPPAANSIEAVTLVILASAVVHVSSVVLINVNEWLADRCGALVRLPPGLLDPYAAAFAAVEAGKTNGDAVGGLVGIALLQGLAAYALIRLYLGWLARRNALPAWIYGWATDIANAVDDSDAVILVYVLTDHDIDDGTLLYAGILYDMKLGSNGTIERVSIADCERYLADLRSPSSDATLIEPLSSFPFLVLEASQIRNVAFEIIPFDQLEAPVDPAGSAPISAP